MTHLKQQPIVKHAVADRLRQLARLYETGQTSEIMDRTLDKLLTYEADQTRSQLQEIKADLADCERCYAMTSDDFYLRYQTGKTDDRMDFVEWGFLGPNGEAATTTPGPLAAREAM